MLHHIRCILPIGLLVLSAGQGLESNPTLYSAKVETPVIEVGVGRLPNASAVDSAVERTHELHRVADWTLPGATFRDVQVFRRALIPEPVWTVREGSAAAIDDFEFGESAVPVSEGYPHLPNRLVAFMYGQLASREATGILERFASVYRAGVTGRLQRSATPERFQPTSPVTCMTASDCGVIAANGGELSVSCEAGICVGTCPTRQPDCLGAAQRPARESIHMTAAK
jgi:hypothetical protein